MFLFRATFYHCPKCAVDFEVIKTLLPAIVIDLETRTADLPRLVALHNMINPHCPITAERPFYDKEAA